MKKQWLNIWKVRYNPSGYGARPVFFDNKAAAEEFAKRDYADLPVRIYNPCKDPEDMTELRVYKSADDVDDDHGYNVRICCGFREGRE